MDRDGWKFCLSSGDLGPNLSPGAVKTALQREPCESYNQPNQLARSSPSSVVVCWKFGGDFYPQVVLLGEIRILEQYLLLGCLRVGWMHVI